MYIALKNCQNFKTSLHTTPTFVSFLTCPVCCMAWRSQYAVGTDLLFKSVSNSSCWTICIYYIMLLNDIFALTQIRYRATLLVVWSSVSFALHYMWKGVFTLEIYWPLVVILTGLTTFKCVCVCVSITVRTQSLTILWVCPYSGTHSTTTIDHSSSLL